MSKDSRKIKCLGNSVDNEELYLHPITLELSKNVSSKKICPSTFYYKNGSLFTFINKEDTNLNEKNIQSFMILPYLNLNIEDMLKIYNINDVDSFVSNINKMISMKKSFITINRIINIWIRQNYNELINNHAILEALYKKLGKIYFKVELNDISNKIKLWFKNNNFDEFHLDLGKHLFM
jgi:hypothetical protein